MNAQLKPNVANMDKKTILKLINAFSLKGTISMEKKDLEVLSSLNRKLDKLGRLAKEKTNKMIFDIDFKKGKLLINNQKR